LSPSGGSYLMDPNHVSQEAAPCWVEAAFCAATAEAPHKRWSRRLLDGLGSSDLVVGIIDDGFDLSHPDLADKAVFPWTSTAIRPTFIRSRT
jgi:hypothetical protein